jgi:endonuclease III
MATSFFSPDNVKTFYQTLARENPNPKSELNYTNPYTLLVAVVLSAQATDKGVNKATNTLFKIISTPQEMVLLGEAKLKEHIKTIGLFNSKAKNVINLSRQLIEKHHSQVPESRALLEALPGVGRKTANVVLNVAFGHLTMAVDTHIFRIGNRTGLAPGKTPKKVEEELLRITPKELLSHAHHWLILHGRYTCTARNPKCKECCVRHLCHFKEKNL